MGNKFTWLDSIFSVPVIGVKMKPWFKYPKEGWELINSLSVDFDKAGEEVTCHPDSNFSTVLKKSDGLFIRLDMENVVVGFSYDVSLKNKAGQLPSLELPDRILNYTEIMNRIVDEIKHIFKKSPWDDRREVNRIGIVSHTTLAMADLPPGLVRFKENLESLWGINSMLRSNSAILIKLSEEKDKFMRQCLHTLIYDKTVTSKTSDEVRFVMDWQKEYYKDMDCSKIDKEIEKNVEEAMTYFEEFGSGILLKEA